MFSKKLRLPSSIKFLSKPFFTNDFCIIKVRKNNLGFNRYAFIISKRVDKRATARNRAKRRTRSYFEKIHPKINKGYDILVIGKSNIINKTFKEISINLENFQNKLNE
jgi:ribonuclease P protein component